MKAGLTFRIDCMMKIHGVKNCVAVLATKTKEATLW